MSLIETGYVTIEELKTFKLFPSDDRFAKGPVAVVECIQEIPCNPCESACPVGAIKVGEPITALPMVDPNSCTGCGLCVAQCPGLAIFLVDKTYSDTDATVAFPYEYFPLPEAGDAVTAVNRAGETVCDAKVVKVMNPKSFNRTPVVTIAVPKELSSDVRSIKRIAVDF
jgi:Fe-S-cluster-containing hydrogenase component 2